MRFCNFTHHNELCGQEPMQGGVVIDGGVRPLILMLVRPIALQMQGGLPMPIGFEVGGINNIQEIHRWCEELRDPDVNRMELVPGLKPQELTFLTPVYHPGMLRSFETFEEPTNSQRARLNAGMPTQWHTAPSFTYGNSNCIVAHGAEVRMPQRKQGKELDFELHLAAVIGRAGRDILEEEAEDYIAGFTILNDWTLRDLQWLELESGLGPSKCKDFATSLGPYLVTPDELAGFRRGKGYNLELCVRINGKEVSRGIWKNMHFSFEELIVRASIDTELKPGDIISSGPSLPSLIDLGLEAAGGWLKPGDLVELEVEQLGMLSNRIAEAAGN